MMRLLLWLNVCSCLFMVATCLFLTSSLEVNAGHDCWWPNRWVQPLMGYGETSCRN